MFRDGQLHQVTIYENFRKQKQTTIIKWSKVKKILGVVVRRWEIVCVERSMRVQVKQKNHKKPIWNLFFHIILY